MFTWVLLRSALICAALSIATPGYSNELRFPLGIRDKLSVESFDRNIDFQSETAALRYFVAVCVNNRNAPSKAINTLKANNYEMLAKDKKSGDQHWQSPEHKPMFTIRHRGSKLTTCMVYIGKAAEQMSDLEDLLDNLTQEDIQRVPRSSMNYGNGERGWVLRPGFEHMVAIVTDAGSPKMTAISLVSLSD